MPKIIAPEDRKICKLYVRVTPEYRDKMRAIAERQGRPQSTIIRDVLEWFIDSHDHD